jgi:2'-phosphotransferase
LIGLEISRSYNISSSSIYYNILKRIVFLIAMEMAAAVVSGRHRGGSKLFENIERSLVKVLRHTATEDGIRLRADGFALLDEVLRLPSLAKLRAGLPEVQQAVQASNKQRLSLQEDGGRLWIRANQGHSIRDIDDEALLTRVATAAVSFPAC